MCENINSLKKQNKKQIKMHDNIYEIEGMMSYIYDKFYYEQNCINIVANVEVNYEENLSQEDINVQAQALGKDKQIDIINNITTNIEIFEIECLKNWSINLQVVSSCLPIIIDYLAQITSCVVNLGESTSSRLLNVVGIAGLGTSIIGVDPKRWAALGGIFNGFLEGLPVFLESIAAGTSGLTAKALAYFGPISPMIAMIAAVILAFYGLVALMNYVVGTTISTTGVLVKTLLQPIGVFINFIIILMKTILYFLQTVLNIVKGSLEFIVNCLTGGFDSVKDGLLNLFGQLISWQNYLFMGATDLVDQILGTNTTEEMVQKQKEYISWGKNDKATTYHREDSIFENIKILDFDNIAYDLGAGADNLFGYMFNSNKKNSAQSVPTKSGYESATYMYSLPPYSGNDYTADMYDMPKYSSVSSNSVVYQNVASGNSISDVAEMRDDVSISAENIKLIREGVENRTYNNYFTNEVKFEKGSVNNNVSSAIALEDMLTNIGNTVLSTLQFGSEGVRIESV